jgi:predicted nicotinamide N-methyase
MAAADEAEPAAANADAAAPQLLLVDALLWEQAPRAAVVAALAQLTPDQQQPALALALASPPPHAPALVPLPPSANDDGYPPDYLSGVLQRAVAMFTKTGSGAVDDALASMLQRALLSTAAEAAPTSNRSRDDPATPLLKTWCYLPPAESAQYSEALQDLQEQVEKRRTRRRRQAEEQQERRPNAAPPTTTAAAKPSSGLVSLRLSPDIFAAGTGATTWAAGFVLAEWLLSRRAAALVRGRRVLELGSGAGLAGVCAWRARPSRLTLTDADPAALRNCATNVSANLEDEDDGGARAVVVGGKPGDSGEGEDDEGGKNQSPQLRLLRLYWDEAPHLPEAVAREPPDDLIIAADVAYDPLILPGLTRALGALLRRRRGEDGNEGTAPSRPMAVVATTVRQEATLQLLLDLARREGLSMTEEAEWWGRRTGAGGEGDEAEAAARAAAEDGPWGDDPRFVTVQGLDRRGIKLHVVELMDEGEVGG